MTAPETALLLPAWAAAVLAVLGLAALLFALDRLGLWLEDRGWLYYRRKKPRGGMSNLASVLYDVCDPPVKHVIELKEKKPARPRKETGQGTPDGDADAPPRPDPADAGREPGPG
jgi:hypothetical protein